MKTQRNELEVITKASDYREVVPTTRRKKLEIILANQGCIFAEDGIRFTEHIISEKLITKDTNKQERENDKRGVS